MFAVALSHVGLRNELSRTRNYKLAAYTVARGRGSVVPGHGYSHRSRMLYLFG